MAGVILPYKISSCELAAYKVSAYFISQGYSTDVKKIEDNGYCVYIFHESFIKNIVGTPSVIKASFYPLDDTTGIEVKTSYVEVNAGNIVKEALSTALIVPGIFKIRKLATLKKEVKKRVLIEAQKLKVEESL